MVDIELNGPSGPIGIGALIDSGADCSLLNIQFAKEAGIDLTKARSGKMLGIGSEDDVYYMNVEIRLKDFPKPITVRAGFIDSDNVVALLGQAGFFDAYRIKFEKDHDTFEISEAPKP